MAYRIVSIFMSSIQLRTRDRLGRLKRLNELPNNQAPPKRFSVEPATRMMVDLRELNYEERLRYLDLATLETRRLGGG